MSSILSTPHIQQHFDVLARGLSRFAAIWQALPFRHRDIPWLESFPDLVTTLQGLGEDSLSHFEEDTDALVAFLEPFLPGVTDLVAASVLGMLPEQMSRVELPASFFRKVPARKAMQIESFARRLSLPPSQLLEWCAGKAHLGRLLARLYGHEMTGVELREELCEVGNELACVHHLPVRLHAQDVMAEGVARWLVGMDGVIGLHACGRLHRRLMEVSVKEGVDSIHLAPCCYFLDEDGAAYGCSRHARQSGLVIKKAHIRLVTQERVIASDRRDTLRLRGLQWRLGFDELQREVWGGESYMKVPSVTRKILRGDFRGFCEHVARVSGRELPHTLDVERYAQEGMKRYRQFRPFEIVRGVFRRPLELLLVLDRALYLEEAGYRVNVGIFCEKHWTPRNLMLQAYILG